MQQNNLNIIPKIAEADIIAAIAATFVKPMSNPQANTFEADHPLCELPSTS